MTGNMKALEIESLVPPVSPSRHPPSLGRRSSSSNGLTRQPSGRLAQRCTLETPRRFPSSTKKVRTFVTVLCCLVAIALIVNLLGSMELMGDVNMDDETTKAASEMNNTEDTTLSSSSSTISPTIVQPKATTTVPTDAPVSIPSSSTTNWQSDASYASSSSNSWFDSGHANEAHDVSSQTPLPLDRNASQQFVERWCDLQGTDWYPDVHSTKSWQLRAPSFVIPGAKMSGTQALASYLHTHKHVVRARSKELGFFFEGTFGRYVTRQEKTLVLAARERMYARDYRKSDLVKDPKLVSFDATPGYLFYSSILPRRMFCVMPWIQLVILLRNPVDRLWEHYLSSKQKLRLNVDFDDWIEDDLDLMHRVGLLNATANSPQEDVAWYEYQTESLAGSVGRSIYVIQLRQWFQALRAMGRNPSTQVLLIQTEDLNAQPAATYKRVLQFLNLDPDDMPKQFRPPAIQPQSQQMSNATRQRLEAFYQPYNDRLKVLLRQHGLRMRPPKGQD